MKYMNMENMTAAQKKKMISHDPDFQYEMNNVMKQIDKSPRLRAKVFDQVGSIAEMWHEQSAQMGEYAGKQTRRNLAMRRKEIDKAQEENLEDLIKNTAEVSAL